ncbi:sulfatase-like hydrolase/transferase [Candidatus Sumerlaeota bacterium]|nr:sulfatase-like hydrolase/transferase [Candidatus Sumerlaeota bacterium]
MNSIIEPAKLEDAKEHTRVPGAIAFWFRMLKQISATSESLLRAFVPSYLFPDLPSSWRLGALTVLFILTVSTLPARQPNFIIILADDLGYGDVGCFGAKLISTPHIDALAAEGMKLTTFYACANICTPSRAGLLTGRYPIRMNLAQNDIFP